ncbi:C1 family peptidase [Stieleria sp. JC731]|uniref:C1 family peptidase n=1 Tax=Pirellulaceae TaxID=2691357 RepID=UPI001E4527E6|nr:C1 family peptidase [Stieleria sp. JC731]MCC9603464.1 C1 family peptidase [Stieleria sp. JC731]
MPRNEIHIGDRPFVLDARPDRVDHRDRPFQPRLVSLPPRWPTKRDTELALPFFRRMVLDQGQEGACTGFGLASVINFVLWRDLVLHLPRSDRGLLAIDLEKANAPLVSPFQLYHLARIYDEWEGEDYEGSSCRCAVKGYHKHGVCLQELWPEKQAPLGEERDRWQIDAATRPLGAYYRIDRLSINDLQAAIYEVGAVYASAMVHQGWQVDSSDVDIPIISRTGSTPSIGAHAFAIIGYEPRGFIVQNSWGTEWGYHGFALLPYDDWADNALDAWVAVMGAPTAVPTVSIDGDAESGETEAFVSSTGANSLHSFRVDSLAFAATRRPGWLWDHDESTHVHGTDVPLSREEAYGLTVVLENDGRVVRRRVGFDDVADSVDELAYHLPLRWLNNHRGLTAGKLQLMIYFHGGLNSEADSLRRVEAMAPYFLSNGIYPLFVTWRTSFLDSIRGILDDSLHRFFQPPSRAQSIGWVDAIAEQVSDATDRAVEVACQHLLVKPVWTQMKQNAEAAIGRGKGLTLLLASLEKLRNQVEDMQVHLIGHSAGSLPIGHWLKRFERKPINIASCRLFAPACSVEFANATYGRAIEKQVLSPKEFYIHVLSDTLERDDRVGPYGKSLLYLVSRALEVNHKEPLLGLQWLHQTDHPDYPTDFWHIPQSRRAGERINPDVQRWQESFAPEIPKKNVQVATDRFVSDGQNQIQQTHGSFDNQVELMNSVIRHLRGSKADPPVKRLVF